MLACCNKILKCGIRKHETHHWVNAPSTDDATDSMLGSEVEGKGTDGKREEVEGTDGMLIGSTEDLLPSVVLRTRFRGGSKLGTTGEETGSE